MYPPYFGRFHWTLMHAVAEHMVNLFGAESELPSNMKQALFTFIIGICWLLNCPGCKIHATQYTTQNKPLFHTAGDCRQYILNFHNAVNQRLNRLQYTLADAQAALNERLSEFGWNITDLTSVFWHDWWQGLLLTTFSFASNPDKPTETERDQYKTFLHAWCQVVPFGDKQCESATGQQKVSDILLHTLQSNGNVDTRENAFATVVSLHNAVCTFFGKLNFTVKEMTEKLNRAYDLKNSSDVARSAQTREEDHRKMLALQKELNELKASSPILACDNCEAYKEATIALAAILASFLLLLLIGYLVWRFRKRPLFLTQLLQSTPSSTINLHPNTAN